MLSELDIVSLEHDLKEYKLKKGAIGTIVHVYENHEAFEVEFVDSSGKTIQVLTLKPKDIYPIYKKLVPQIFYSGSKTTNLLELQAIRHHKGYVDSNIKIKNTGSQKMDFTIQLYEY